ncbi:hypothetical protein L9F63_000720 [Diploptera punctata]|uniref:Protein NATD1 n=1 Tax=Diploptera punctata TaxID=6984 RepID=A0AAD8AM50_DIPPU|nr:hypothetical protein L9F63_000720 [Diploptera punctata]
MLRRVPQILTRGSLAKFLSSMQSGVIHDVENSMFYIDINNDKAYVQYDKVNGILDLFETEVPVEFRGKGIAQILAKAVFDHVVTNDLKMKVTCTYLQDYLAKNPAPEYVSRVVD